MRRREFIASTGAVAATWPLAARAQQTTRMRHVGVLMTYAEADPDGQARLTALLATLRQSGWTDNRNCQIDIRWSAGDLERMRRFAKELVALAPDVMAVMSTPALEAVQQETQTVPIVFIQVSDPVGAGFVRACRNLAAT